MHNKRDEKEIKPLKTFSLDVLMNNLDGRNLEFYQAFFRNFSIIGQICKAQKVDIMHLLEKVIFYERYETSNTETRDLLISNRQLLCTGILLTNKQKERVGKIEYHTLKSAVMNKSMKELTKILELNFQHKFCSPNVLNALLHNVVNCINGLEVARLLLKYGAEANASLEGANVHVTSLYQAIEKGTTTDIANLLIEQGAKVSCRVLHFAIYHLNNLGTWSNNNLLHKQRFEVIKVLIPYVDNINKRILHSCTVSDCTGRQHEFELRLTAMHMAAHNINEELMQCLLSKGADINDANNALAISPLHFAIACVHHWHSSHIAFLVNKGADINAYSHFYTTPLHTAIYFGNIYVIKRLTDKDADCNIKRNGQTAQEHANTEGLEI